ncbi:MAG: hypothetical protein Q8M01_03380 [Rubrivivax sp.]|nr:hypothetical protein [Rubrivivax sp.]
MLDLIQGVLGWLGSADPWLALGIRAMGAICIVAVGGPVEEIDMCRLIRCGIVALTAAALTACYIVPERGPDGQVIYQPYPLPPLAMVPAPSGGVAPATLPVRLYPANDVATRTGRRHRQRNEHDDRQGCLQRLLPGRGRTTPTVSI